MAPSPNLGASMSSTLIVPAGASTQLPPQSTNSGTNDNGGGGLQQKGANYFFGFLIAFVVLLLVFVACGITSRRRFLSRRPMVPANIQPWGISSDGRVTQAEPVFYERFIGEPAQAEDRWRYTMPLSASLLRGPNLASPTEEMLENDAAAPRHPDVEVEAALPQPPPQRATTASRRFFPPLLSSWLSKPAELGRRPSLDEKTELIESPEALEVAVVIAMPSPLNPLPSSSTHPEALSSSTPLSQSPSHSTPPFSTSSVVSQRDINDEKSPAPPPPSHIPFGLAEYEIGLTHVPWHKELNSTPMPASSS